MRHSNSTVRLMVGLAGVGVVISFGVAVSGEDTTPRVVTQVPTTLNDFHLPGTQPEADPNVFDPILGANEGSCDNCHGGYTVNVESDKMRNWAGSMMAQAGRDPLFLASMTIANQDAAFAGDLCLRCHAPAAWLSGRSTPTDGSGLTEIADFEGTNCNFCHRLVDPEYDAGVSPAVDLGILTALGVDLPLDFGSGQLVVDPDDGARRGPIDGISHPQGATAIYSPFHSESNFCGSCHDVSNPVFVKQGDGTYAPNVDGAPHPTGLQEDMFPVERTFSEWKNSDFANGGVQMNGRFGGNHATGIMESCQDCHMPDAVGSAAKNSGPLTDSAQHAFNGGNTWMLDAIRNLYPDSETFLSDTVVAESQARAVLRLENASDMDLLQVGSQLRVRITNFAGHKLPTGYPEGRRMWLHVEFYDDLDQEILEYGHYDDLTAVLDTASTKVYEAKLGVDSVISGLTGVPEGESFHFALNNVWLKDNRIPPLGFTNAGFESVQAAPVGYSYADGQNWDDTLFDVPVGAVRAEVELLYQTVSKEYVDFLVSENVTDSRGTEFQTQWALLGKSPPVLMDSGSLAVTSSPTPDLDGDGDVDGADLGLFLSLWGTSDPTADLDGDGTVDGADLGLLLSAWGAV